MQRCDKFMDDLSKFIEQDFMFYISKKREHQMKKLIQKCSEKKEKYGQDSMLNF